MNLHCGSRILDLRRPVVMGVLNVTPDSFSDGGNFYSGARLDPELALRHAREMLADGAAIIDVGGESTRPGATPVPTDIELQRVLPVVRAIAAELDVLISVDTSSPEVIRESVAAGAHLVNDIRALQRPGALAAVAATGAGVCLMHMQGTPADMQRAPSYGDVVGEVRAFLAARLQACRTAGIEPGRLCVDPGFGFGKRVEDNLELLRRLGELGELADGSRVPVLAGLSRKSLVSALTGRPPEQRLAGSLALACMAAAAGASIIRAHDVAATVDVLKIVGALQGEA